MTRTRPVRSLASLAVLGLAAATALSVLPAGTGSAAPKPSLREVEQRVNALNVKVDVADEQYAQGKIALAGAKRRASVVQGRVGVAQAQVDAVKKSIAAVAASVYKSGGTNQFVQLVNTSTPQTYLDRASSLDRIAASQRAQMAAAATARDHLDAAHEQAAKELADQQVAARAMAAQRAQIEHSLAEQQQLLSSLKAAESRRLTAGRASRSRSTPMPASKGPVSGRAGGAVQEAQNKLGSPYKWGATGPDQFDCSGLTMWVWGKAGVSLPHSSQAQYDSGQHVSRGALQPGDLTFYGSPIHHVGIYIGNGQMISAPHTGDVVKVQDALRSDYVGAVRP